MSSPSQPKWQRLEATAPSLTTPCLAALNIPYLPTAHRFQTLNVYLPLSPPNEALIGTTFDGIPPLQSEQGKAKRAPNVMVYIHGGAWRAYTLTARSIEPTLAYAFAHPDQSVDVVISINYSLSPSEANVTVPEASSPDDPSRNAVHPKHVEDVRGALGFLHKKGLRDGGYVVVGHSAGGCLVFQSAFSRGLEGVRPAAVVGLNGLYDLPQLVVGLGKRHGHLRGEYERILGNAFGEERRVWEEVSPARFDVEVMSEVVQRKGKGTEGRKMLVWLEASEGDELAPNNGTDRMELQMRLVEGVKVVRGRRIKGGHAEVWEKGEDLWGVVSDVLKMLNEEDK